MTATKQFHKRPVPLEDLRTQESTLTKDTATPKITLHQEMSVVLGIPYSQLVDRDSFEEIGHLGYGSFSDVFSAHDSEGLLVALKDYNLGIGSGEAKQYFERRGAFQREVRMYEELGSHEQIPTFLGVAARKTKRGKFAEFQPTIVMEHVSGKTLQEMIDEKSPISPKLIRDILEQSISPLKEIHHGSSVPRYHRDIKPANLKLNDEGLLYLLDFGTMRDEIIETMGGTMAVGSAPYVHKQQLLESKPTFQTELYSLGRTLYALSLGRPLKAGEVFSREKMDSTNVDNETKNVIGMLCDEDLGCVRDIHELESLITNKTEDVKEISSIETLEVKKNKPSQNDKFELIEHNGGHILNFNYGEPLKNSKDSLEFKVAITPKKLTGPLIIFDEELNKKSKKTGLISEFLYASSALSAALIVPLGLVTLASDYPLSSLLPIGTMLGFGYLAGKFRKITSTINSLPLEVRFGEDFDSDICKSHIREVAKKGSKISKIYIDIQKDGKEIHFSENNNVTYYLNIGEENQSLGFLSKISYELHKPSDNNTKPSFYESGPMFSKEDFENQLRKNKIFKQTMNTFKLKSPSLYEVVYAMLPDSSLQNESNITGEYNGIRKILMVEAYDQLDRALGKSKQKLGHRLTKSVISVKTPK